MRYESAVGYKGGLKPVINLIQVDSRDKGEPLPSLPEGGRKAI